MTKVPTILVESMHPIEVEVVDEKVKPKHDGCDKCIHREVAERCRACGILTGAACYTGGEMYPDYEEADE